MSELPEVIDTERLKLRPHTLADIGKIEAVSPGTGAAGQAPPFGLRFAEEYLARRVLRDRSLEPSWAIEVGGRLVGDVLLLIDRAHCRAELAYSVVEGHRGRGYATEAAAAAIDAAFKKLGLSRIYAEADSENIPSGRVLEKLGMTLEGRLRRNRYVPGAGFRDTLVYGILRGEWKARSRAS